MAEPDAKHPCTPVGDGVALGKDGDKAAPSEPAAFDPLSLPTMGDGSCFFDRMNKGIAAIDPQYPNILSQHGTGRLTAVCGGDVMRDGVHYLEFTLMEAGIENGIQLCLAKPGYDPTSRRTNSCVTETSSGLGYCTRDGKLRVGGGDRPWTEGGGQGAATGEKVGLLLDLEQNTLAVYRTQSSAPTVRLVGKFKCVVPLSRLQLVWRR